MGEDRGRQEAEEMEEGGKVQDLSEQWCGWTTHGNQEPSISELGLTLPRIQEASEPRDNLA